MELKFKKTNFIILALCSLLATITGFIVVHLQGFVIDALVHDSSTFKQIIVLLVSFAVIQLIGAYANILSDNLGRFFAIGEFTSAWKRFCPQGLHRTDIDKNSKYYNALYNNIPRLFSLKNGIIIQTLTAILLLAFFVWRTYYDRFWIAFSFIPIIGLLSFLAAGLYEKRYKEGVQTISNQRVSLMAWLESWFRAYRERTLNWRLYNTDNPFDENEDCNLKWFENQGIAVGKGLKKHAMTVLKRDFFGAFLVDWPYIFCLVAVMYGVYEKHLTIGEFIIWKALIDYLNSSFSSLRGVRKNRYDIAAIEKVVKQDLQWLKKYNTPQRLIKELGSDDLLPKEALSNRDFQLLSGATVNVGLEPGFYHIKGGNGSGKSTLIDTLLGFNDEYTRWSPLDIAKIRQLLSNQARVVERDPIIFPDFNDNIYAQIFGVNHEQYKKPRQILIRQLTRLLPRAIAARWGERLKHMIQIWNLRPGNLSTGEKVILSFFRAVSHWDNRVKVFVIDECDAVLDQEMIKLFHETIEALKSRVAVWYVSHAYQLKKSNLRTIEGGKKGHSYVKTVYLMGYERQSGKGFITPAQISALSGGSGRVRGDGNIGQGLCSVFETVLRAFIHIDENYKVLTSYDFHIDSTYKEVDTGEVKSAGLALAIGILNISRSLNDLETLDNIAATGLVLLDGCIAPVRYLKEKTSAALGFGHIGMAITSEDVRSLIDLEEYIYPSKSIPAPTSSKLLAPLRE